MLRPGMSETPPGIVGGVGNKTGADFALGRDYGQGLSTMTRIVTVDEVLTEADFQGLVLDVAETFGWEVFHDGDSRRSNAGFPDLVLVKDGRIIFAELKREKNSYPSKPQMNWLALLGQAAGDNVMAVLWRPSSNWQGILSGKEWR